MGEDCIGCAKTGSGKTLAFALPILQKLCEDPYGIFALVLTPTKELAFQVKNIFHTISHINHFIFMGYDRILSDHFINNVVILDVSK